MNILVSNKKLNYHQICHLKPKNLLTQLVGETKKSLSETVQENFYLALHSLFTIHFTSMYNYLVEVRFHISNFSIIWAKYIFLTLAYLRKLAILAKFLANCDTFCMKKPWNNQMYLREEIIAAKDSVKQIITELKILRIFGWICSLFLSSIPWKSMQFAICNLFSAIDLSRNYQKIENWTYCSY